MADEKNTATEVVVFEAELVRGSTYMYKGASFKKGVPRKVTKETKEYLEANAYDDVMVGEGDDMELERRGKFEFRVPGAAPATRTRSRSRS